MYKHLLLQAQSSISQELLVNSSGLGWLRRAPEATAEPYPDFGDFEVKKWPYTYPFWRFSALFWPCGGQNKGYTYPVLDILRLRFGTEYRVIGELGTPPQKKH